MPTFQRDRFTWLAYVMLGYYAYLMAVSGPLMPFLGEELQLSYTERGYHFTAFALGMVLAGLWGDRLAARWGRSLVFWAGGAGMAFGALWLLLGQSLLITVGGVFLMGFLGTWLLVMIQATLTDHHGERSATALTEANILASGAATLAPFLVGTLERVGLGWRGALALAVMIWLLLFASLGRTRIPATRHSKNTFKLPSKLPAIFWIYWTMVVLLVSVEWGVAFWGADFLEKVVRMPKVDASTAMTFYFLANIVGRALGSRLSQSISPEKLLLLATGVGMAGFMLFWQSAFAPLNLVGLFFTGLGVSNLFPLALSAATGLAPAQSNTASARISLAAGTAILVTPQLLARVADDIGIQPAYAIVPALLVGVLLVTLTIIWLTGRKTPTLAT